MNQKPLETTKFRVLERPQEYVGLKHDGKAPIENLEQGDNRANSHRLDTFHQGITGGCSIEQFKVQV